MSMTPGVTYLPCASITVAPAGTATVAPTSATLPFSMRTAPGLNFLPVPSNTTAFWMTVVVPGQAL